MIAYAPLCLEDIHEMLELSAAFFDGSPTYRHIPRDYDKVVNLFEASVHRPEDVFCMVARHSDGAGSKIVGAMLGVKTEYYFSRDVMASDIAVFVSPEYRNSRIAVKLVDKFRQWAISVGCREICIGATTGSHGNGYERLLNRLGYETVGFVTKKQIEKV